MNDVAENIAKKEETDEDESYAEKKIVVGLCRPKVFELWDWTKCLKRWKSRLVTMLREILLKIHLACKFRQLTGNDVTDHYFGHYWHERAAFLSVGVLAADWH